MRCLLIKPSAFTASAPPMFTFRSSPTVDQKKERADRLARQKRHSRCDNRGKRGHYGKGYPHATDSSSSSVSSKRHKGPAYARHTSEHKEHYKIGKRNQANLTAGSVPPASVSSESVLSEVYCVQSSISDPSIADASSSSVDSGATEHMTDQRHWFNNIHSVDDQRWSVTIADYNVLYVRGVGDVTIHATVNGVVSPLLLDNVLYNPRPR